MSFDNKWEFNSYGYLILRWFINLITNLWLSPYLSAEALQEFSLYSPTTLCQKDNWSRYTWKAANYLAKVITIVCCPLQHESHHLRHNKTWIVHYITCRAQFIVNENDIWGGLPFTSPNMFLKHLLICLVILF